MRWKNWLASGVRGLVERNGLDQSQRLTGRSRRKSVRPSAELLEDRLVPATYALDQAIALPQGFSNRDVFIDSAGNTYSVGGTTDPNFAYSNGTYVGGPNGRSDILAMKFSPQGNLLWSTVIGSAGDGDEYAYAVEADAQGDVYVAGRAAQGLATTPGALQTTFEGYYQGSHGYDNAFLAKLDPNGHVAALTYFGTAGSIRDLTIDPVTGDILVASHYDPTGGEAPMPSAWFANAAQKTPGGDMDGIVARISGDLSHVIWATYVGGSGREEGTGSVRLDGAGNVYYATNTTSPDLPVTANAFQKTYGGNGDLLVAKYTPGGSLVYETYYGGSGNESTETHNLGVDAQGNAYVMGFTKSADDPMTPGAFQPTHAGLAADTDYVIAKLSPDGSRLLAATYLGSSGWEGVGSIVTDRQGQVYISGSSGGSAGGTNYPVTADAFRSQPLGGGDAVFTVMSSDLRQLVYSTYFGGSDLGARADGLDVNASGTVVVRVDDSSTDAPLFNTPWPGAPVWGVGFVKFTPGGPTNQAPIGVSTSSGNQQVQLSWSATAAATSYNIYRATTPGGEGSTPYRIGVSSTSFTDTGLTNGTTYYYQVSAVAGTAESGKSSEVSTTTSSGALTGASSAATAIANLTAIGTVDWEHWGNGGVAGTDHKATGGSQISAYSVIGSGTVKYYNNDLRPLSWSEGSPTTSSPSNTGGVYVSGVGNGFSLSAPADTTQRTLTVYIAAYSASCQLVAHLSDGSAVDFVDTTPLTTGLYDRTYTLTYQAGSAGQRLIVSWTQVAGTGNIAINGAALSSSGTAPTVTANPSSQTVTASQAVTFSAAASGSPTPTVQWQVSSNGGGTWTSITGATANSYTIAATTASQDQNEYRAVFSNSGGSSTSSAATLTVLHLTSISVSPNSASVSNSGTQQFTATALDQFGHALAAQPAITWAVAGGGVGGTISSSGLYTAPASGTESDTVQAASGSVTGQASITVTTSTGSLPIQDNFNTSPDPYFAVQAGTWNVSGGTYNATATSDNVSTLNIAGALPANLQTNATINVAAATGYRSNGFVIFNYQSPTNFLYAGVRVAMQSWVIGQRTATGWNDLTALADSTIAPGTTYALQVLLQGAQASLSVNGTTKVSYTFGSAVESGSVGLATQSSLTHFDNLLVQATTGSLPIQDNFNASPDPNFVAQSASWNVSGGTYNSLPAAGADAVSTLQLASSLPTSFQINVNVNVTTALWQQNGFVIFNYRSPTDFDYAGVRIGAKAWVIGHHDATGWNDLTSLSDNSLAPGVDYGLQVLVQGSTVTLSAGGITKVSYNFGTALNLGAIGLGTQGSVTHFDGLFVQ
jgi:fibronectin type 3 domain-containing protein